MKYIYIYALVAITFLGIAGCNIDLPFPKDEVRRTFAIDVTRVAGTAGLLGEDGQGNYQVTLTIPWQNGDLSKMSHVQILAVLTNVAGATTAQVVGNNIPVSAFTRVGYDYAVTVTLNIADIYSKFGKTNPTAGELLMITANVVHTDGEVFPGWTRFGGFRDQHITGWDIGSPARRLSTHVRYAVVCSIDPTIFTGNFIVTASNRAEPYPTAITHYAGLPDPVPTGVNPDLLFGLKIEELVLNNYPNAPAAGPPIRSALIWINTDDFSVISVQQANGMYWPIAGGPGATPQVWAFSNMLVDTCSREIRLRGVPTVPGVGAFAGIDFVIRPAP